VPEHGSVAGENVEFVQGARAFVHQDAIPAEYADAKPESRTTFEARAQGVLEKMRMAGMSINEIANFWKMSKAGVWNRVGHVQPTPSGSPPVQTPTTTPHTSSLSQPTNDYAERTTKGDDGDGFGSQRQLPRANSEIFASRPR